MLDRLCPGSARSVNLAAALCVAAGLALAGCTIDAAGTGPAASGGGGAGAGSGTGGSGGAGTTTSTGTGGQGGTGGGGAEDCLDSVDNDGDGDADCADSDCNPDFECVPAAPSGWAGPLRVQRVDYPSADPDPTCPDDSPVETLYAGSAGNAQCGTCNCAPDQTAACTSSKVTCYFGSGSCNGSAHQDYQVSSAACASGPSYNGTSSCQLTGLPAAVNPAACTSTGGALSNAVTWQDELHVCGQPPATGGGCASGSVCAPKAAAELDQVCVSKAGSEPCPDGWTAPELQAYEDFTDDRACTQCGCSVGCMGGGFSLSDYGDCSSAPVPMSLNCTNTSLIIDGASGIVGQLGTPAAQCVQSMTTGSIQTTGPTKICCAPAAVVP